jgi:putative SOS response-associated peptidase YedK
MCGRFDNLIARDAYRGLFKANRLPKSNFPLRYNITPTDQIPIVRIQRPPAAAFFGRAIAQGMYLADSADVVLPSTPGRPRESQMRCISRRISRTMSMIPTMPIPRCP